MKSMKRARMHDEIKEMAGIEEIKKKRLHYN